MKHFTLSFLLVGILALLILIPGNSRAEVSSFTTSCETQLNAMEKKGKAKNGIRKAKKKLRQKNKVRKNWY